MNKNKPEALFFDQVLRAYENGTADRELPADDNMARSLMPPCTSKFRNFFSISSELPELAPDSCVGCMECVTQCPDSAIVARVLPENRVEELCTEITDTNDRNYVRRQWLRTTKYFDNYEKKGKIPGLFGLFIDPLKCKGCGECVSVCGEHNALKMTQKTPAFLNRAVTAMSVFLKAGDTPSEYILSKSLMDMMLSSQALGLYCGGAGSCMGCGEATVLRMFLAATGFVHSTENIGIVAATGCNTVYTSTYPYNPYQVPWTNSLFENACAVAMGIRLMWDRYSWHSKRLWCIGGDGAFFDIGFQSLSRMLMSGMDIKVLVLDTQVYSNTGGQASTASFMGQETKYSMIGKDIPGKTEKRKELSQIAFMHPDTFVAQVNPAYPNHFYRAVIAANEFNGPAVLISYAACQPEHGIGDDQSYQQAKLAVESRAFPLLIYDPRKGKSIKERLDLSFNPAVKEDWHTNPTTKKLVDFITFASSEGRFARHFDKDGIPSSTLLASRDERLENWRRLQELAGIKKSE